MVSKSSYSTLSFEDIEQYFDYQFLNFYGNLTYTFEANVLSASETSTTGNSSKITSSVKRGRTKKQSTKAAESILEDGPTTKSAKNKRAKRGPKRN